MDAEETEVVAGAQSRHEEGLLGLSRRRFLDHLIDQEEILRARNALPADRAEEGQQVLARGLHARNGAGMGLRGLDDLLRAASLPRAEIDMVADHMGKR